MNLDEAMRIESIWDSIEDGEPDISTERLIVMTAQSAGVSVSDVADALYLLQPKP